VANSIGPKAETLAPGIKPGLTLAAAIEPLLCMADLATILNYSHATAERMRAAVRLSHKVLRFSLDDVLAALKRPTLGGEAKP
jgi:hypothetical protein